MSQFFLNDCPRVLAPTYSQPVRRRIDPTHALFRTEERAPYPVQGSLCNFQGKPSTSGISRHLVAAFDVPGLPRFALVGLHLKAVRSVGGNSQLGITLGMPYTVLNVILMCHEYTCIT